MMQHNIIYRCIWFIGDSKSYNVISSTMVRSHIVRAIQISQGRDIHSFGSKFNLQQNGHHLNAPFMLITMIQIPAPYLIPSPRYLAQYIAQTFAYSMYPVSNDGHIVSWYVNESYKAGNRTIVISMKSFQMMPQNVFSLLVPFLPKIVLNQRLP